MNRTKRRRGTRLSDDGLTVSVRLYVDRKIYEYAHGWALFHVADTYTTAEEQLEGYLADALREVMEREGWSAPPEIEALYPEPPVYDPGDELPL